MLKKKYSIKAINKYIKRKTFLAESFLDIITIDLRKKAFKFYLFNVHISKKLFDEDSSRNKLLKFESRYIFNAGYRDQVNNSFL